MFYADYVLYNEETQEYYTRAESKPMSNNVWEAQKYRSYDAAYLRLRSLDPDLARKLSILKIN